MKISRIKYIIGYSVITSLLNLTTLTASSQCIERKNIGWSEDRLFLDYGFLCPSYNFALKGDTSKNWNTHFANIDIRLAPPEVLKFKSKVDRAIKKFAGSKFCQNLEFESVQVCYPEQLKLFRDNGADVSLENFKSRYTFSYSFQPDTITGYNITVAVSKYGKIITPFIFPSEHFYKPIDKSFTYCKLIEIAKKAQKNIDSVGNISFEYDKKKMKFYWHISQALVNEHEGANDIYVVDIDAADLKKITTYKSQVFVTF